MLGKAGDTSISSRRRDSKVNLASQRLSHRLKKTPVTVSFCMWDMGLWTTMDFKICTAWRTVNFGDYHLSVPPNPSLHLTKIQDHTKRGMSVLKNDSNVVSMGQIAVSHNSCGSKKRGWEIYLIGACELREDRKKTHVRTWIREPAVDRKRRRSTFPSPR